MDSVSLCFSEGHVDQLVDAGPACHVGWTLSLCFSEGHVDQLVDAGPARRLGRTLSLSRHQQRHSSADSQSHRLAHTAAQLPLLPPGGAAAAAASAGRGRAEVDRVHAQHSAGAELFEGAACLRYSHYRYQYLVTMFICLRGMKIPASFEQSLKRKFLLSSFF